MATQTNKTSYNIYFAKRVNEFRVLPPPKAAGNPRTLQAQAEGGSVTGAGTYDAGTQVSVEAIPNEGYKFDSWSDGDTFPTREVTMNEDMTLTATFAPVENTAEGGDQNTDEGGLGA